VREYVRTAIGMLTAPTASVKSKMSVSFPCIVISRVYFVPTGAVAAAPGTGDAAASGAVVCGAVLPGTFEGI
jgi:hypothetical protein